MTKTRENRWATKAECLAYVLEHKPTGLRLWAALDYLQGYGMEKIKHLLPQRYWK